MPKPKAKKRRDPPHTNWVPGEDGKLVKLVLIPPTGRGKIDPRKIRAAVKKVIEARRKAEAEAAQ